MAARKRSTATTTKRRTRKASEKGGAGGKETAADADAASAASEAVAARPYPLHTAGGQPVSVVHVVAELAPFARTGGLGEAVANLAKAQSRAGLAVSLIMPLYRQVREVVSDFVPASDPFFVQVGPRAEYARLFESQSLRDRTGEGMPRVYFVDNEYYFGGRDGIYGDARGDYGDNDRRWAYFALASLTALPMITQAPVMMHCHDWHTALAPAYLRAREAGNDFLRQTWTVITVHNAGFQGHFPPPSMADVGLPWEFYNHHMFEWYGKMNMLKGGMACADAVTTVSPTHAHELRTEKGGFGLHDAFVAMRERFVGIINGIDNADWNPANDPFIAYNYSRTKLSPKKQNKLALQRIFGLPERPGTPVIGMSARMVAQKGLDLILGSPRFLSLDAQFIFLGQGEKRYVDILEELAALVPGRIGVQTDFTVEQEHRLLAGADMIVMPSQYEPCGLTQMRAQRYGTLPVARKVGGLADTIEDNVTGFLFDDYTQAGFISACARAIDHYRHPQVWTQMVREAMGRDFGWERSEGKYRELYRRAIHWPRGRR
ncbi:MAG: glycogen synthase [Gemmatimonadaceae bacterium]|nr:glycogen synthase [Gemmatimonadaceae bacterium]HNV74703.1 glycogen/starch synthase [Gemmatimonadaceae bacterium]